MIPAMKPERSASVVVGCSVVPGRTLWLMGDDFDTCLKSNIWLDTF